VVERTGLVGSNPTLSATRAMRLRVSDGGARARPVEHRGRLGGAEQADIFLAVPPAGRGVSVSPDYEGTAAERWLSPRR
jgi:hypothetical protein